MIALWSILVCSAGAAPEAEGLSAWWQELPVADVQLTAPEGGLPEENLEVLLRVREGRPLRLQQLRLDLATLYRVGSFASVEADVEPFPVFDDQGEPQAGVLLSYIVYPAPIVARVSVLRNRAFPSRKLLDAAGLATGQVYYEDLDADFVAKRVTDWLRRRGYPRAEVTLRATEPSPGRIHVVIDVEEGEPDLVEHLAFGGDYAKAGVSEARLRRWVRRAGVAEGKPLALEDVTSAQDLLREKLGTARGGLHRGPGRGYIAARVTPAVLPGDTGPHVTFTIEPGPRLELEVFGMGPWPKRRVREALGIDHRLRLTGGFLDRAPDLLETYLQERGWLTADAKVEIDDSALPDRRVLTVQTKLGPRHTIGDVPDLEFLDFEFSFTDGPGEVEEERLKRDLQAIFDQASPDVLRQDFYTEAEMEIGRIATEQYFTGQGHLEAEVVVEPPEIRARPTLGNLARWVAGVPRHMRVTPRVTVTLGPITTLSELSVSGAAPGLELSWLQEAIDAQIGAPFSPQAIEQLSRRVLEAHRAQGYLEAESRVTHQPSPDGLRRSVILVDPGPRILLRSIVTQGRRLTRREVIVRTVDLRTGQPIRASSTPDTTRSSQRDLEQVRADLYELGIFRTITMDLIGDEAARDLVIAVNERPRYAFELGGGASTDQGVRTFLRMTRRNLFGLAHQLQLLGQVGLDYGSDNVGNLLPNFTKPEWRAAASYTAPRFPGPNQQLTLDLILRDRRQERTWRIDRSGGGGSLRTSFGRRDHTELQIGTRLELRQLNQYDEAAILPGEAWTAFDPDDPDSPRWRVQEAVTALVLHDLRDDPLRPGKGALLSLNGEWAPGLAWRDQPRTAFLKTEARVSGYVPLGGFTLKLAGGGGAILPLSPGVPPLEDRFRLGGTGSLRGFIRDGVGPHNIATRVAVDWPRGIGPVIDYTSRADPERWVPTGGDTVADGTFELLMPLTELGFTSWDGYAAALFLDVGNVWLLESGPISDPLGEDLEPTSNQAIYQTSLPFLRVGTGAGMRIDTPVGPLQLDLAVNPQVLLLKDDPTRHFDRYDLLVRGWEEPAWRFHLTLGSLF
ncbi:MAG TPA: hypothetical protein ENK18_03890 [Deltaproteobacteria bacterium]|nr:hypothetical protein [Deltaproteobacteria bacterium]